MGRHQKYLIKLILSFSLIFSPILAWAGAAEKWEIVENVYDHSSQRVNVTARKIAQQAANSGVYRVKVPVDAATLGSSVKTLLKGGIAVAAITALVEGVGWIIDEGGTIKKLKPTENPNYPFIYIIGSKIYYAASYPNAVYLYFQDLQKTSQFWSSSTYIGFYPDRCFYGTYDDNWCSGDFKYDNQGEGSSNIQINRRPNPNYVPDQPQYVPVTDLELGDEVLGNGHEPNSATKPASDIITQAYDPNNDTAGGHQTDTALENANPEPETDPKGETKPKPNVDTDGDGKPDVYDPNQPDAGQEFTFPPACDWFPAACDFFKVQKQDNIDIKQNQEKQLEQDKNFFEKVTDFFDWFKEDPSNDNELDIEQSNEQEPNTTISFSTSCPAKIPLQFNWNGQSLDFSFDFTIWCQAISTYVYPIVVTLGSLHALYIVTGVRQDG